MLITIAIILAACGGFVVGRLDLYNACRKVYRKAYLHGQLAARREIVALCEAAEASERQAKEVEQAA